MIAMPKRSPRPKRPATPARATARRTAAPKADAAILPSSPQALRKLLSLLPHFDPYGDAGDCKFDRAAAEKPLRFFKKYVRNRKGAPLDLQPWQVAVVANLFGWLRPDGTRRFREVLIYVPRKNGKTTFAAGLCLYTLLCDGEPDPEIYSAASTHNQAKLLLRAAKQIARKAPKLAEQLLFRAESIVRKAKGTRSEAAYRTLAADADATHGLNPHLLMIDELHAIHNREFFEALTSGDGERDQPITIYTTTASHIGETLCNEKLKYAKDVCAGVRQDRSLLPAIYEASPDDDWTDPKTWAKANPSLGVSIKLESLREKCNKASASIAAANSFKRLHLNLQTGAASAWLKLDVWDQAPALDVEALKSRPCWGGLDLGATDDLSAFVLAFPPRDASETWACLPWFWAPEENARERARRDKVPYLEWAEAGLLTLTDGSPVTDRTEIRRTINEIRDEFPGLVDIGLDMRFAQELASGLEQVDGFNVFQVAQRPLHMAAATRELERLVLAKQLAHGGHPVLRWMANNVRLTGGRNGSDWILPSKEKSTEKIDGIVALIMALARAMTRSVVAPRPFIYATQGVRSL